MLKVKYLTNEEDKRTALVLELKNIVEHAQEIHELIDVLVAEARKDDEVIDWEKAKKELLDPR